MSERSREDEAGTPVERLSDGGAATGPSGPAYATLAEGHRRAGRAHEAESLARAGLRVFPGGTSGRLALALALLDQRRIEEARREVEGLLESLSEFQAARGALAALIGESGSDGPEGDLEPTDDDAAMDAWADEAEAEDEGESEDDDLLLAEGASPFATRTMAGLLERQGHAEDARALRARLESPETLLAPASATTSAADEAFVLPEPAPLPDCEAPEPAFAVPEAAFAPSVSPLPPADSDFAPSQPDFTPRAIAADPFTEDDAGFADFADDDVAVSAPEPALDATARRRAQVISTLERWLENLRRGVA